MTSLSVAPLLCGEGSGRMPEITKADGLNSTRWRARVHSRLSQPSLMMPPASPGNSGASGLDAGYIARWYSIASSTKRGTATRWRPGSVFGSPSGATSCRLPPPRQAPRSTGRSAGRAAPGAPRSGARRSQPRGSSLEAAGGLLRPDRGRHRRARRAAHTHAVIAGASDRARDTGEQLVVHGSRKDRSEDPVCLGAAGRQPVGQRPMPASHLGRGDAVQRCLPEGGVGVAVDPRQAGTCAPAGRD